MHKLLGFFLLIAGLSLAGCSFGDQEDVWFDSKEEAIEGGLQQNELNKSALLAFEEYRGETIVFFKRDESLGTAVISEGKKGVSWHRDHPYNGFEAGGDLPYSTVGFDLESNTGEKISILAGKVFDSSIQLLRLNDGGVIKELKVDAESGLFFAIHEAPYSSLVINPIK
ncbi:hypothetical protein ACOJQI_15155 [Bacillus salacetis]|uniref:hypothetical protein n=1 Tax=Bacillus salacetis TaxID=2315464 RepID=UPI003B9F2448